MCGGIVGALCFGLEEEAKGRSLNLLPYLLAYNSGRIFSYALAGTLSAGALGALLELFGPDFGHRQLQWIAALLMVAIGLYIAGWLPGLTRLEDVGALLWKRLEPFGRRLLPVRTLAAALACGAIWGWLPCGLVYTMLLTAATQGGAVEGALYMMVFGLGTLPVLVGAGLLAGRLYMFSRRPYLRQAAGCCIILFAGLTLV